jgi:hypothetical protein
MLGFLPSLERFFIYTNILDEVILEDPFPKAWIQIRPKRPGSPDPQHRPDPDTEQAPWPVFTT